MAQYIQMELLPQLKQIHVPADPSQAYVDIVAVHGILDTDTRKAWTVPDSPEISNPESWLTKADMLPRTVPIARVFQCRYRIPPPNKDFADHLRQTSERLTQLITERIIPVEHRPIIFLAHGYGGLVVLKTLINQQISLRTVAVACFAVPFRLVQRCSALPGAPSDADTAVIALLANLLSDFRRAPNSSNIAIRCFYETKPEGDERQIVPLQAASLADDNAGPSVLALSADHKNINKFISPTDPNFELVCDVLDGWLYRAYHHILTQAIIKGEEATALAVIEEHKRSIATNEYITPALEATVSYGRETILRELLKCSVNVNAPINSDRDTVLMLAARTHLEDSAEIVRMLLEKGADVTIENAKKETALTIAESQPEEVRSMAIIQLLKDLPPIRGPSLKQVSAVGMRLEAPKLNVEDFGALKDVHARIADVYEVGGSERTFLRHPSVQDLIYEPNYGPRYIMNRAISRWSGPGNRKFRWMHLPANNISWVKDLITRSYQERPTPKGNVDEARFYEACSHIIDRRYWESQVSTSPIVDLTYLRFLTPQAMEIVSLADGGSTKEANSTGILVYLPYLHYENSYERISMAKTIRRVRKVHTQRPANADELNPDQKLLWAYLRGDMPLHCRRTLDEFFYDALDSDKTTSKASGTTARNRNQVVQRYMQNKWPGERTNMLMVDQLWMVLLLDNNTSGGDDQPVARNETLITAFPQRWDRLDTAESNSIREADLAGMIATQLSNENRAPMESAWDMFFLVLDTCTGFLYDEAVHRNEKLRFFDFFASRLQEIANAESESFAHLREMLGQLSTSNKARDRDDTLKKLSDELLDVSEEVDHVNEIKDINEELSMIARVLDAQLDVMQQLEAIITYRGPNSSVPFSAVNARNTLATKMEQRRIKVQEMHDMATRTHKALNNLFDLKQNQANVLEAHYSRKVSQDSERNAIAILVFTVSGAIFLPLTFMAQFYALSVDSFPHSAATGGVSMSLTYVSARVFGIGFGIALVLVGLAFGMNFLLLEGPFTRANRLLDLRRARQTSSSLPDLVEQRKEVYYRPSPATDEVDRLSIRSFSPRDSRDASSKSGKSPSVARSWSSLWKQGAAVEMRTVPEEPDMTVSSPASATAGAERRV